MLVQRVLRLVAAVGLVWLFAACASTPEDAFKTPIAGTRVSVALPESYWLADGFQGVVGEPAGSSILVTEMSDPKTVMDAQMSADQLLARGMELIEAEEVEVGGQDCLLVHVTQTQQAGPPLRRWILVLGDDVSSSVLVASTPLEHEDDVGPALVRALESAERDPLRPIGPFDGLGFSVEETEVLEIVGRDANVVALRERGRADVPRVPADAEVIVGRAWAPQPIDAETLSEDRLSRTPELTDIAVTSRQPLEIDGMSAFELVADAVDGASAEPLTLVQTLVVDGGRYYIVQGRVGRADAERFVPEFRAVAAGFRRSP